MKMKRVCIVVPPNLPMPPVKGGAIETLMQYIVDVNEVSKAIDLTIISLYSKEAEECSKKYKNTKYIYYKWNKIDDIKYFIFRVLRKIFNFKLRYFQPYEYFVTKYVIENKFDVFVNESADFTAFKKISDYLGKDKCFAHLHSEFKCEKIIDDTFGTIISVSDYIKNKWLLTSKLSKDQIVVLRNCVDKDRFCKDICDEEINRIKTNLGFDKNDFIVLFCGRIVEEKGALELIEAINNIKDDNVKLMVIGSPNFGKETKTRYLSEVEQVISRCKERIIFTGYVDNSELYKYYAICDCSVVPSTYEDPAPLVPIEGLMAEKPLIITNSGGAIEYVDEKCAIIVEKEKNLIENLTNSIIYLKRNHDVCCSMQENAKERSKLYTKEKYFNNFIKLILGT